MIHTTFARTLLLVLTIALCANTIFAQEQHHLRGIPGYLDPFTGQFRSLTAPIAQDADTAAAPTTSGGTFVFSLTITVSSTIASTTKIFCEGTALVSDTNGIYEEAASVSVLRGTGSTVTCTVKIPYSWLLNNASTDQVSTSYTISTATSSSTPLAQRLTTHSFPPSAVPANGSTTTITFAPTI